MSEYSPSQPPGWYYAQGDPPGTQRYWDGAQWVGGPQAAQGAEASLGSYGQVAAAGAGVPASYGSRFVAALIDGFIYVMLIAAVVALVFILGSISDALGQIVFVVGLLAVFGYVIWNYYIRQGMTGQTLGKSQQKIRLVADGSGQPPGIGMTFLRYIVAGFLFGLCLIPGLLDLLWPLWDEGQKRLTDKMLNLSVVNA